MENDIILDNDILASINHISLISNQSVSTLLHRQLMRAWNTNAMQAQISIKNISLAPVLSNNSYDDDRFHGLFTEAIVHITNTRSV